MPVFEKVFAHRHSFLYKVNVNNIYYSNCIDIFMSLN